MNCPICDSLFQTREAVNGVCSKTCAEILISLKKQVGESQTRLIPISKISFGNWIILPKQPKYETNDHLLLITGSTEKAVVAESIFFGVQSVHKIPPEVMVVPLSVLKWNKPDKRSILCTYCNQSVDRLVNRICSERKGNYQCCPACSLFFSKNRICPVCDTPKTIVIKQLSLL